MNKTGLIVLAISAAGLAAYFYLAKADVVVTAEGADDLCGSYARAKGKLNQRIRLKSRASRFARTEGYISAGTELLLCDEDNGWHGVIVIEDQTVCLDRDNRKVPRPYDGPCISGWLPLDQVELMAG